MRRPVTQTRVDRGGLSNFGLTLLTLSLRASLLSHQSMDDITPAQISFVNLSVLAPKTDEGGPPVRKLRRQKPPLLPLLNEITGVFPPGHLCAILGPSGAGKTIFLNALAGKMSVMQGAELSGEIYVNQEKIAGGR